MRTLAVWVVICAAASGQQRGSLSEAEVVVVGGLIRGASADLVSKVQVTAQLRVLRVLKGEVDASAPLILAWEYEPRPHEGPTETARPPEGYGLWALKKGRGGAWQPLALPLMGWRPLGGVFQPLPEGEPTAEFSSGAMAGSDERIAAELAWALATQAAQSGNALQVTYLVSTGGPAGVKFTKDQTQFERTAAILGGLPIEASSSVYRRMLASPFADVRAVAVAALLKTADADAVSALERDAPLLAKSISAMRIGTNAGSVNLAQHPEALQPLARVATGEVDIPGLDASVARQLGFSQRPEALPFLAVMLESWNSSTRVSAALGICQMLRQGVLHALWKEEMTARCAMGFPMKSADEETAVVEYWKKWWSSQRTQIAALGPLPQVSVPRRYRATPAQMMERFEVPMDQRFSALLMMTANLAKSGNGEVRTPLGKRLNETDEQTLSRIAIETERKLQEASAAVKKAMDEMRAAGRKPSQEEMRQANARMERIMREGLDQTRRELSGDGWRELEKYMTEEMNAPGTRMR